MKKSTVYLLALIVATGATVSACSNTGTSSTTQTPATPVQVITPLSDNGNRIIANGQVQSKEIARLGTRLMGSVTSIRVKKGEAVQQGQLLLTISDEELQAKKAQVDAMIAEAEAAYQLAQKDETRFAAMLSRQTVSAKEYENVHLHYLSMKAKVEAARQMKREVAANRAYTQLTAPFSGVVSQINIDLGALANPGMPLIVIEKGNDWVVESSVTESDINRLKTGMKAVVTIKSAHLTFEAPLTEKSRSSVETGGQYKITLAVPAEQREKLYSGMYAQVVIPVAESQQTSTGNLLIPTKAVVHKDGLTGVFVVSATQTASLRWIRTGKVTPEQTEVTTGLKPTDQVILPQNTPLENGMNVKPQK